MFDHGIRCVVDIIYLQIFLNSFHMYMYIYVCVYVYSYVYTQAFLHLYECLHMYMHIYACIVIFDIVENFILSIVFILDYTSFCFLL